MLPQRANAIRALRFEWAYPGEPPFNVPADATENQIKYKNMVWTKIWQNISRMQGLQHLHVDLLVSGLAWASLTTEITTALVRPIAAVTKPNLFELSLPLDIVTEGSPWESLPCHLMRSAFTTRNKHQIGLEVHGGFWCICVDWRLW